MFTSLKQPECEIKEKKPRGPMCHITKAVGALVLRRHGHCFSFQQLKLSAISVDRRVKVKLVIVCKCSRANITLENQSTGNKVWADPSQICQFSSSSIQSTLERTKGETAAFQQTRYHPVHAGHRRFTRKIPNNEKGGKGLTVAHVGCVVFG